jgi:hypothetical protein
MMIIGMFPLMIGLGAIDVASTSDTPLWVVAAAGFMFICGGMATIVGYALGGGMAPDGDLASPSIFLRLVQYTLGLCIVGSLLAIFSWIAFGPGERQFTTVVWWPWAVDRAEASEQQGRTIFGAAAIVIGVFLVAGTVAGVRRIRRAAHRNLS